LSRLRDLAKRSRFAVIAVNLVRDAWLGAAERLRPNRRVGIGARHRGFSLDESLDYVDWVVGDYERFGGLDAEMLDGASVLELGPGDSLGVALRLLGLGASRVVCLDRFRNWRDPAQQARIDAALRERMPAEQRNRLDGAERERLELIEGTGVEEADRVFEPGSFGAIVSRAVLAHVYDLDRGYAAMDAVLAPGGAMAHNIDVSDHGAFSAGGQNPLTYLTVPDSIWDRVRRRTGHPNRKLIDYHRRTMDELGYEAELLVTRVIGAAEDLPEPVPADRVGEVIGQALPLIEEIRPRLLERFRALPDEDLAVAAIFLRARKPEADN
jgi:SAM-dependent methyltransferase